MGRRSEPRIVISFPVIVRGFDLQRRRFSANAQTRDISGSGASLEGINHLVQPRKKIEIEFGTQSAWYSVEWVGKNGTSRAGRVGVRCLEKKYIWNVPAKPWERDIYRQDAAPQNQAVHLERGERRMYPRRACRLEVQISTPGVTSHARGTVTDISLGGCYVEMFAPLPVDSVIELDIDLEGQYLRPTGRVRSSQTSFGMGVAFTGLGPGDFERLREFAPPDATGIEAVAAVAVQPQASTQAALRIRHEESSSLAAGRPLSPAKTKGTEGDTTIVRALEAVIRALLRKGILSQEDLAEEFEKVKAAKH